MKNFGTADGIRLGVTAWALKQVEHLLRSGVRGGGADVGQTAAGRGGGAAGVEGSHRAHGRERVVARRRVRLLVGAGVGAAVEQVEGELAAADVIGGVEVLEECAGALLRRLEDARHRAGDVGDVRELDGVLGDARLVVVEAVAGPGLDATVRGVVLRDPVRVAGVGAGVRPGVGAGVGPRYRCRCRSRCLSRSPCRAVPVSVPVSVPSTACRRAPRSHPPARAQRPRRGPAWSRRRRGRARPRARGRRRPSYDRAETEEYALRPP